MTMKKLTALTLALVVVCAAALAGFRVYGQTLPTTQPVPVAAFFQPTRNLARLAAMGVDTFFGPEVENRGVLSPDAAAKAEQDWINETIRLGVKCVLKRPVGNLPPNCVGVLVIYDEPNGKGILPDAVKANADTLRTQYPGVRIFLSLAGDKITSANLKKPAELALLQGYLAAADVVTVDVYSMNRNASRYKTTWTADAVRTVLAVRPDVDCWAWVECNDQQLAKPTSQTVPGVTDINRAPTPQEIDDTATQAVAAGAKGIGWFITCDTGKYGWPGSYIPDVDRNGASMQPQYDKVAEVSRRLGAGVVPPPPATQPTPATLPTADPAVAALQADLAATRAELAGVKARLDKAAAAQTAQSAAQARTAAALDGMVRAWQAAATQPAGN